MSNITVTNLPVLTSLSGSAQLMVVQNGVSSSATAQQVANLNANGGTVTSITATSPLSGGTITSTGTIGLNTGSITNSYLSTMLANTIKGNNSGSAATPQDLTVAQTMTLLGAAPLNSPTFTGNPQAPTPLTGDSSASIATTAYVQAQGYALNTVSINAGTGLSGGGALTTSRTLSLASIASNTILANATGSTAAPTATNMSAILDGSFSSVQGSILYRSASNWSALPPGISGQILQSGGSLGNPSWISNLSGISIIPRISSISSAATINPNINTTDQYEVTAQATVLTVGIPTGSPVDGQKLILRIKDNGSSQALTWVTSSGGYRAVGVTFPSITTIGKVGYYGCIYNSQDNYWDVVAISQLA